MAVLQIKNVSKVYPGGVRAVDNFDLSVRDGEFIVLVGPSGCGKSTMLRMIAGLESITQGEMTLDGRVINKLAPVDRDISMVFQDYALYYHLSVYDNVGMSLKVRHEQKEEIYDRVTRTSGYLGLDEYLNRLPGQLSGGQKQRVALGRAITRSPKLYLMDEPLSNLDAKLRAGTRTELVRMQKQLGVTTIYVTHDQVEAMTMADRLVVMKDGIVQQIGTPQEVYSAPANLFVAGFIGLVQMNLLTGEIKDGAFYACGERFPLTPSRSAALSGYAGKPVVMGIRPEHVRYRADSALTLPVENEEYFGYYRQAYLRLGDACVTARLERGCAEGARTLPVAFDMDAAHFFDADTTARLTEGGRCA